MLKNKECGICHRLTAKEIYNLVNISIKNENITEKEKYLIFKNIIKTIHYIDSLKGGSVFCGRRKKIIIGSLVYIFGIIFKMRKFSNNYRDYYRYSSNNTLTQRAISNNLEITIAGLRNLYTKMVKKHKTYFIDEYGYIFD